MSLLFLRRPLRCLKSASSTLHISTLNIPSLPISECLFFGKASAVSVFVMVLLSGPVPAREVDWNRLHLTPEQESRIHQLEDSWEKTHSDVASRIEQDASELRAILPTGDAQRIRQLQNRITANKMFLMNQSMDIFLQKRNTLTPEQRLQLRKMLPARCRRSR